jgi:hypothetical protein
MNGVYDEDYEKIILMANSFWTDLAKKVLTSTNNKGCGHDRAS